LQLLFVVLGGFSMGSALLHLIGAAAGLPLGVLMLRRGWVDCEGWDWFSRRAHRTQPTSAKDRPSHRRAPEATAQRTVETAAVRFANLLRACDVEAALRLHGAIPAEERSTLALADRELLVLELSIANRLAEARPVIAGVLHDDPGNPGSGLRACRAACSRPRGTGADRTRAAGGDPGAPERT
jgi:hypothetical protein